MAACPTCGADTTVHVGDAGGLYWFAEQYCENCTATRRWNSSVACSACGSTVGSFVSRGLLGCGQCYTDLGAQLAPLVEKYRGSRGGSNLNGASPPGGLAKARTLEIVEALAKGGPGAPGPNRRLSQTAEPPDRPVQSGGHLGDLSRYRELLAFETAQSRGGANVERAERQAISVRVRVCRNLEGVAYPSLLSAAGRQCVATMLLGEGAALAGWRSAEALPALFGADLVPLKEERLLPESVSALLPLDGQSYCLSGDEDHLRFISMLEVPDPALSTVLSEGLMTISERVAALDELYVWQEHPVWGWLAACPGNSGAGVRISFGVELPRLRQSAEWPRFQAGLVESGLEVRGGGGEGSQIGPRLQISNRGLAQGVVLAEEAARMLVIVGRALAWEQRLQES